MLARGVIVGLAAFALLLHAFFMVASPRINAENALTAALQVICSGQTTERTDLPASSHGQRHAAPCALCGLGHAAIDAPNMLVVSVPANVSETLALPPDADAQPRPQRAFRSAQPRAPPALV